MEREELFHMKNQIVRYFEEKPNHSGHIDEAATELDIKGCALPSFFEVTEELVRDGVLERLGGGYYRMEKNKNRMEGIYRGARRSYGFVVDIPGEADLYIPEEDRNGAMHNDRVRVEVTRENGFRQRREGRIVAILERANTTVIGTFELQKKFGFVKPDDERIGMDIFIPLKDTLNARSSAKVLVEITKWPDARQLAEGKITQILGYEGDVGVDINCIMASHKLPFAFPEEVELAANKVDMNIAADEKRLDLRDRMLITIDGEDAKDLDDAVEVELLKNGNMKLGVHIADVSHYVPSGGIIDREAYERGTSVYLVDRVIPMLPKVLSNGICSLNAQEDRYAMSCIMEINPEGKVVEYQIAPSIINVKRRCNYREVYKALEEDIVPEDLQLYMEMLRHLKTLALWLREMRHKRGSIDFDFPEYKILLSTDGTPLQIVKRDRTISERMIEEAMLIANETVAVYLRDTGSPTVFRVHESPSEEKLETLQTVVNYLGLQTRFGTDITPGEVQAFLQSVKGKAIERTAEMMTLRSLQQAKYSTVNIGHFGLASSCYTHFTSPIRRYPDLMIHRLLKKALHLKHGWRPKDGDEAYLTKAAEHSSIREQVAVKAERDTDDLKKAQYMLPYVGHVFEGIIRNLTDFGMFVEIDNGIDGLVHINSMEDDYYFLNKEQLAMVGRLSGKEYHLGDIVRVTLAKVDVGRRTIDFVLGEITDISELSRIMTKAYMRKQDNGKKKRGKEKQKAKKSLILKRREAAGKRKKKSKRKKRKGYNQ